MNEWMAKSRMKKYRNRWSLAGCILNVFIVIQYWIIFHLYVNSNCYLMAIKVTDRLLLNCKIKNNHSKLTILRISFLALSDIWVNRFSYISSISLISVDLLLSNSEDFWKYIHKSIRKWFLKYIINMNLIFILILIILIMV